MAFGRVLRMLAPTGAGRVLVPAYVGQSPKEGSGIHDPIVEAGLTASFYRLDARLRCQREDFERALAEGPVACVAVHYFGFPEPAIEWMAERCREARVPLIEDCAHCTPARPDDPIGREGDFLLHSLHKILPIEGGGMVTLRSGTSGAREELLEVGEGDRIAPGDLEVFAGADLEASRQRRRENYQKLAGSLAGVEGVRLLHPDLPERVAPLNLPLLVDAEGPDRFAVYRALRERDVEAVALYHTLIAPLMSGAYPVAQDLSARILNLPCHQDLDGEAMDRIASLLPEALEAAREGGGA